MTNSKKSNENRDKFDVDLDAMLDEAESSLGQFQDEEDAIDRLLMNAGFDTDDTLIGTELNKEVDVVKDIDLDDLLNIDGFSEPLMAKTEESELTTAVVVADEADDLVGLDDELDMILHEESATALADEPDATATPPEELNDFSDFSGFNEPESTVVADDDDDLLGLFEEFDRGEDNQLSAAAPIMLDSTVPALVEEPDDFPDFSDVNEANIVQQSSSETEALPIDESEQVADDAEISDEADDFFKQIEEQLAEAEKLSAQANLAAANDAEQQLVDDDDGLDSLLMSAGFDQEEEEQTAEKADRFEDDPSLTEIDNFFQLDEVSDDFSKQIENQLADAEKPSNEANQEDDFLLPDFDITADVENSDTTSEIDIKEDQLEDPFPDTDFLSAAVAMPADQPETAEVKQEVTSKMTEELESVKLAPSGFEPGDIEKQLEAAISSVKKTKLLTYVALGFTAVALSSAIAMGVMTYQAKAQVSKLTQTVTTLEANLGKITANSPNEEINAKVTDVVAKQDMVSKALIQLQAKMGEPTVSLAPPVVEPSKIEVKHESAPSKAEADHAPPKESAVLTKKEDAHGLAPAKVETKHEVTTTKVEVKPDPAFIKVETKPETVPVKIKPAPEITPAKVKTQPAAKPVIALKAEIKEQPVKPQKSETPGVWGVNLVAFKQEWFAKSKAAEFARQGVFAEVVPVPGNMYRLRVGGFKSKAEANANKQRLKNALNLSSVWVSDN